MDTVMQNIKNIELRNLLRSNGFTREDKVYLIDNFEQFLENGDNQESYIVEFDKICPIMEVVPKDYAMGLLTDNFLEDENYVFKHEDVYLNIATFKDFCLIANTDKSNIIKVIYNKVESIYNKNIKMNIEKMEDVMRKERSEYIVKANHKKFLVYIMTFCLNGKWYFKIGKSDNLHERVKRLSTYFNVTMYVVDVFLCKNNSRFEQFVHKSALLSAYKYTNMINGKSPQEIYSFTSTVFEKVKKFMLNNVRRFDDDITPEDPKLRTINNLTKAFEGHPEMLLAAIEKLGLIEKVTDDQTFSEEEVELEDAPKPFVDDGVSRTNLYGPLVQIYDANDITKLLKVFESITEVTREVPNSSYSHIKYAARKKTIYLGYRWFIIERGLPTARTFNDIGKTFDATIKKTGLVAMLNKNQSTIEMVFQLQKDAAKYADKMPSVICNAVKFKTIVDTHYFILWDELDDEIKAHYMEDHDLPGKAKNPRGKSIEQIDPVTKNVVNTYGSMSEIVKIFKISPNKINEMVKEKRVYKGFLWRMV